MIGRGKRGISPVIATVLLVLIAIVLAAIIFVWARAFFVEKVTKFGSDAEQACNDVRFQGSIAAGKMSIVNQGNTALYGIKIIKVSDGSTSEVQTVVKTVTAGQSVTTDASSGLQLGDKVLLIPVILGQTSSGNTAYACASSLGVSATVG